jgi:hypothetical protein
MKSITYTVDLTYKIKGFENYQFGKDKCLYNLKTSRKIKQSYKSGSIGYWLNGNDWISIKKIKEENLLYKPKKEILPF